MLRFTRLTVIIFCTAFILVQLMPAALCEEGTDCTYEMCFMNQTNSHGAHDENQMYFPTGLEPKVYDFNYIDGAGAN